VLLEVIACSLDDAVVSAGGGADRIELCAALPLGGITPSLGLLTRVKRRLPAMPVMFMLRPRAGGFAYGEGELAVMERDAELALEHGANGLVFGILTPAGDVDAAACRRLLRIAQQRPGCHTVFHRGFDVVADPRAALEQIIDLGFTRVLTSGRARTSIEGAEEIRRTIERAGGRIEVMPGGGVRPDNAASLIRATGANQLHASLTRVCVDTSTAANRSLSFGEPSSEGGHRVTDERAVRAVRAVLDELSLP